eukprot:Rmarinus@m.11702
MKKFLLLLLLAGTCLAWGSQTDKIDMRDIQVLSLAEGQYTTGRRASPVPQMSCIGGSASNHYQYRPKSAQCYNKGWDGNSVQWKCEADLDNHVQFGKIEVTCEGYDRAGDINVLVGSCGLEYTLDWTPAGQQGNSQSSYNKHYQDYYYGDYDYASSGSGSSTFGKLILIGVVMWIVWKLSGGLGAGGASGHYRTVNLLYFQNKERKI